MSFSFIVCCIQLLLYTALYTAELYASLAMMPNQERRGQARDYRVPLRGCARAAVRACKAVRVSEGVSATKRDDSSGPHGYSRMGREEDRAAEVAAVSDCNMRACPTDE